MVSFIKGGKQAKGVKVGLSFTFFYPKVLRVGSKMCKNEEVHNSYRLPNVARLNKCRIFKLKGTNQNEKK
jgi:hypothetical protein